MTRINPEVERLTRECAALRSTIARLTADPGDMPVRGCGDNSCVVAQPSGMATNGGCRCEPHTLRRALAYYKRLAAFREETIRELRAAPSPSATVEDERAAVVAALQHEASYNWDEDSGGWKALMVMAKHIEHGYHRQAGQ